MESQAVSLETELQITATSMHACGRCAMCYYDYRLLLEHLYWRHGTESHSCQECGLKRWRYAAHVCYVLPIFITLLDDENEEHCFCGREVDAPMIGCDGPACAVQWYHFPCVGIVTPPDGDWLCPTCKKLDVMSQKSSNKENRRRIKEPL